MQTKNGSPRQGYTTAQVDTALGFATGGTIRWGVDVVDSAGNSKTTVVYATDTAAEWNAGTHYGTSLSSNTLIRT